LKFLRYQQSPYKFWNTWEFCIPEYRTACTNSIGATSAMVRCAFITAVLAAKNLIVPRGYFILERKT
jgi:hypothetical protein